jgi:UDP-N-acetylmuramoyl-L-alanyl-D-glutamate--2,6-diaminopimelate ligase
MGTKQKLVKIARDVLPNPALRLLEESYRRGRGRVTAVRYGNPAKDLKILAVTGTNGKTTTANYLNAILKAAGFRTAMFTTALIEVNGKSRINDLNATIPTTEQLQEFFKSAKDAGVHYVILEATSHALVQHKLDGLAFELAMMTNLTQDHLDYHGTMENYAAAKGILFSRKPRYIILNRDDKWYEFFSKFQAGEHTLTYGVEKDADARIQAVRLTAEGSDVKLLVDHQTTLDLHTSLPGKYNVYNATCAASGAYALGVHLGDIQQGIASLHAIPGRFERVPSTKPFMTIVDYAHTPDALQQLLETTRHITKNRVILVFGATGDRDKTKRPIMGEIASKYADRIFVTDEESYNEDPAAIRKAVLGGINGALGSAKTEEIPDRKDAIAKAISVARTGDTILITGMGHEKFRIVNGERIPWNDTDVARQLLEK